jgi:signal peptidase I
MAEMKERVTSWLDAARGWMQRPRAAKSVPAPKTPFWAFIDLVREPVLAVLFAFVATTAIAQPFYVPSGSMEPTLQIGDALIATKYDYGYSRFSIPYMPGAPKSPKRLLGALPKVGDVVVFRLPRDISQTYVKRVIGLPGDRVQMRSGRLWINGKELPIHYVGNGPVEMEYGNNRTAWKFSETLPNGRQHPIYKWTWSGPLDDTGVYVVPKDHIFVMGDNRDDSLDSRVAPDDGGVGFVPLANLVGHAEIVVGSYDYLNAHTFSSWLAQFRLSRFFSGVR